MSLLPSLHGASAPARDFVYSELDYAFRPARLALGRPAHEARAFSIRDRSWRYVHWLGLPDQLYDLERDPQELHDLGGENAFQSVREAMRRKLCDFLMRRRTRHTVSDEFIERWTHGRIARGVRLGEW
jgi:arylsulfatase A-like enzyme